MSLLVFLVYIPTSKHLHLLACPFNEFFRNLRPRGIVKDCDVEDDEALWIDVAIQDTAGRITRPEVADIRRRVEAFDGDAARFKDWVTAFYDKRCEYAESHLIPLSNLPICIVHYLSAISNRFQSTTNGNHRTVV